MSDRQTLVVRGSQDVVRAREMFRRAYARLMRAGVPMAFSVGPWTPPKSTSQRNTLHMWFGEIADQTGSSIQEVKDFLVEEFLGTEQTEITFPNGRRVVRERLKSTERLSRAAYTDLMERVQAWAAENDLMLTEPDPDHWKQWRREAAEEQREGRAAA
jgi:ketosteroid isomerase-like protein